ncbi:hypothetical protein HK104_004235 [Borealophlyctis nickersoniae]|nr:hypothetical protein HK104_004235 [Borealophlyctis nickersoniae]
MSQVISRQPSSIFELARSPSPSSPSSPSSNHDETWLPGIHSYDEGTKVEYQGEVYVARRTHCPLFSWEPPANPTLWKRVDADEEGGSP